MFKDYPDILNQKQLAEALGVCEKTARKLLREGKIGYKKIGSRYLVPKRCLIDYVCSARYNVIDL